MIPNLATYVHINGGLQLFAAQPQLKRVPVAIDRAIRDITPVVERSVTISCVTTQLMLKDFAMEPDETRMRKAAQLMVQNLAGSLALVTCKEPLRVACGNHLRSLLQQAGADAQLMEQVVQVCAADNLDLGCTLIEKAATEKAVRDVEEALAPAFAIRRKHREQTGLPYYDMSIFTNGRYPASLPEALRPSPAGCCRRSAASTRTLGASRAPPPRWASSPVRPLAPPASPARRASRASPRRVRHEPAVRAAGGRRRCLRRGGDAGGAGAPRADGRVARARRRHPRLRLGRRAGRDGGGDGRRAAAVGLRRRLHRPAPRRRRGGGRGVGRRRAALGTR